ncbi:MAG: methylenetetrahydrofolate reductase [NAD(P)H] [Alphaproteobacteria bacterium]|nr:methylenetetrahydrofolate reductase [NAD(P)H] [Alphaproteobacteria bacterium]
MALSVSFEFFPPRTDAMEAQLWRSIERLAPLNPAFVSVTYGAGGSTRERTHATIKRMRTETQLKPAAHLTCVGSTAQELEAVVRDYLDTGVRHIVALRGDMPEPGPYAQVDGGYASTPDMIKGIRSIWPFEISVSAYPEKHPESPSIEHDYALLKAKIDAGATRAITQFVFDTDVVLRFADRAYREGIRVPIVPGIMPPTNFKGVVRMAQRSGATVPLWLVRKFEGLDDDLETRKLIAATVVAEQVEKLRRHGFDSFHFYTLNQADLTYAICHLLGVRPQTPAQAA